MVFALAYTLLFYVLAQGFFRTAIRGIYQKIDFAEQAPSSLGEHSLEHALGKVESWREAKRLQLKDYEDRESYRREFLGNVSHELKTPIFNIQAYVLTLLDGAIEDPEVNVRYLKKTEKSINRMIRIVNDLEGITQLESGFLKIDKSEQDLTTIIEDAIEVAELRKQEKHIEIKIENTHQARFQVLCDRDRMRQAFVNLLLNAIKYGKEGGNISIKLEAIKSRVRIDIVDDGIGIAEEHLPRLFERFYRVDNTSRTSSKGGSGLGLAIVKHILEAHDSEFKVSSIPEKGTTFSFYLSLVSP
ncbi:MAG: sensor histidine kinase [Flavobacteriales bacterium]